MKKNSFCVKVTCAAAGLAAALLACSEYERRHFVTEHVTISSPKIRDREKELVFLTDLHEHAFPESVRPGLEEMIRRISPDAVLAGGDMIFAKGRRCRVDRSLALLRSLAEDLPVFYADGNHEDRIDWSRDRDGRFRHPYLRALEEAGVLFLRDRGADLWEDLRITGVSLEEEYYSHRFTLPVLPEDYIRNRVGAADPSRFQILLMHSPLFFRQCASWGADLTLSGHFHGGTVRIPGLGGLMTPQYQFFVPWCAGSFSRDGRMMIVGRGLGTHSVNLRLNNRPQLLWITLAPEKGRGERET